ncbi:MAG: patatin-like phospholipase family protein [Treponema sp.]|nr:patatin-like phospholipase family protein [Treponema sp.]
MARIGLVLSGGMAKGAYQIGALKAIKEFFEEKEIIALSSASIGTLNAFAYATDSIEKGVSLWKNIITNDKKIFISTVLKGNYLQNVIKALSSDNKKINCNFFLQFYL